jgi:hypothetical protein
MSVIEVIRRQKRKNKNLQVELDKKEDVTREKLSMAKGKPQQKGMTAEINSIPTYVI